MSVLNALDVVGELTSVGRPDVAVVPKELPKGMLDPKNAPILAAIDTILRAQLLNPFASIEELARIVKQSKSYVRGIITTAAYRAVYEQRRKELDLAIGLPTIVEELDAAARCALDKIVERVEQSDDGYLAVAAFKEISKARGTGGHAPMSAPVTNILVDARQAAVLGVREAAMAEARAAGPYPEAALGRTAYDRLPTVEPAGAQHRGNSPSDVPSAMPAAPLYVDPSRAPLPEPPLPAVNDLEAELDALPGARPEVES